MNFTLEQPVPLTIVVQCTARLFVRAFLAFSRVIERGIKSLICI